MKEQQESQISLDKFLGKPVMEVDTGSVIGRVADFLSHPLRGELSGVLVQLDTGQQGILKAEDLYFRVESAETLAAENALWEVDEAFLHAGNSFSGCRQLLGADVVTRDGRLLGQIVDVLLTVNTLRLLYKVSESRLSRLLGKGFYLTGDTPCFYSSEEHRLFVPARTAIVEKEPVTEEIEVTEKLRQREIIARR